MIYVPDLTNYECFVIRDTNTLRAYKTTPENGLNIDYRDYYINSNYLYQDGTQTFSQYTTLPVCLSQDVLTDNVYYRNDFDKILVITFILLIICFYFPYKVISRLFGRWLKL